MSALDTFISNGASALRETLNKRGLSDFMVAASDADRITIAHPPLHCEMLIGDLDLSPLPSLFYDHDGVTVEDIVTCWDACAALTRHSDRNSKQITALMSEVYPKIPFDDISYAGPLSSMVQFLRIASWSFGRFNLDRHGVSLSLKSVGIDKRLTVGRQSIDSTEGYRRLPKPLSFRPFDALCSTLGRSKRSPPRAGALLRRLSTYLPDLAIQINALVAAAVHGGPVTERRLIEGFEIDYVPGVQRTRDVMWAKALRLINEAHDYPFKDLVEVLEPTMNYHDVIATFGAPVNRVKGYTHERRLAHRMELLKLQAADLRQIHLGFDDTQSVAAAEAAIQLTQSIR
jgi:hypothetical protein